MIRSDIRSFFRQLPGLFRNDYTAVLPVKLALDLLGHFVEHGMLRFDDDDADPLQS